MIAPLPESKNSPPPVRGKAVHRLLLPERDATEPTSRPWSWWKSWLLAAWMSTTAIVYLLHMLGKL